MSRRGKRFVIVLAVALVAAAAVATAVYAVGRGASDTGVPAGASASSTAASIAVTKCKNGKGDAVTNDAVALLTSSTTYVPIPGISFASKFKGCVFATISGYPFASGGEIMFVRVLIDGTPMSPTEVQMASDTGTFASAHSVTFVGNVANGDHTVTAEFRSFGGGTVSFNRPSLVVQHG